MKKILSALAAAALLVPSVSFAAPTFRLIDSSVVAAKPEIVSFVAAEDSHDLSWEAAGAGLLELSVRCRGGARMSVDHEDGTVSYVQCDGKLHPAYRFESEVGQTADVALQVTGDKAVKVYTILKIYQDKDGKKGKLADKAKVNLTVAPETEDEE